MPGVPSFHETGFADFEAPTWWGFFGPARIPAPIQRRMQEELTRILAEPETRSRVEALGMDVLAKPDAEFARFLESEIARWGQVVRENDIRLQG
jgi:tripartite-type tricarboxylate transporter receptor subunit TctC